MIKEISNEQYIELAQKMDMIHLLNTSHYANAREQMGWLVSTIGLFADGELIGAAKIHKKKLPKINSYFCYIPRGPIIDYHNQKHLELFTTDIKEYLKGENAYALRIDPELEITAAEDVMSSLSSLGYKHQGLVNNFEGTQPRHTIKNDLTIGYEEIYKKYDKRAKKYITNALSNGIEIISVKHPSQEQLDSFMEIMEDTAKRGGYIIRSREYFEIIFEQYKDDIVLNFARFNPNLVSDQELQAQIEDLVEEKNELLREQEASDISNGRRKQIRIRLTTLDQTIAKCEKNKKLIQTIKEDCKNEPLDLASAIFVELDQKAWYWFSGSRTNYRELNPVYALLDNYIKNVSNRGLRSLDLLGISGDFSDKNNGLYQFKKSFGGDVYEFIGEYDLVIKPGIYHLANKVLRLAQSSQENPLLKKVLAIVNK